MTLDLDKIIAEVAAWDFSITRKGRTFHTLRPTIGLTQRLEKLLNNYKLADVPAATEGMFTFAMDWSDWMAEEVLAAILSYMHHWNEVGPQHLNAIARRVHADIKAAEAQQSA